MSLYKLIKKNLLSIISKTTWEKKAIWLAADYPEYISYGNRLLTFNFLNLEIKAGEYEFLLDGFDYLRQLNKWGGFSFIISNGIVNARGNDFDAEIQTAEELFILKEILLNKDYNFQALDRVVVVDIGMNVGLASLYFASREDVEHVYGFEPFKPTYKQCIRNMNKNKNLANKITANNFGLSHNRKALEVDYNFDNKGQVGIHGTGLIRSSMKLITKEKIELFPILSEIHKIIEHHLGMDLVCKIDCEGGEYDFFESFSKCGIPDPIKIIMMEWHRKAPNELLSILKRNNFRAITIYGDRQDVGMIYAFKES
ncbi:MAG: FkbM family methyltransferase [Candidatus Electrothrix communis]|nr:MAG: FkbM family methyltransferase [Candidatus Electrothrix communis]